MNSSRTYKRRTGRKLTIALLTAGVLSAALTAPAHAAGANAVTAYNPLINLAAQSSIVISGTADSAVSVVKVSIDDMANTASAPITASVTLLPGGTAAQSWSSPAMDLSTLDDGLLTITSLYDDVPAANDPITAKDSEPPQAPTVFPEGGATFASPTDISILSLDPADSTYFSFGTPTATDPTATPAALVPAAPAPSHTVGASEQVKAIAFDPAGNPSPIMVANFTLTVTPTTTTLGASPASPQVAGTPLLLTASVNPATTSGTFAFFDGPTSLGTAAAQAGTATKTIPNPTPGAHTFTATFTPTNPTAFGPSTSTPAAFTITTPPVPVPAVSGSFTPLPTVRVFDGTATTSPRLVQIAGLGGVPASATAVMVNTEVSGPTAAGYVRVTPAGQNPGVATQEFTKGQTISNLVAVKLVNGKIQVKLSAGSARILMDVPGYYTGLP